MISQYDLLLCMLILNNYQHSQNIYFITVHNILTIQKMLPAGEDMM